MILSLLLVVVLVRLWITMFFPVIGWNFLLAHTKNSLSDRFRRMIQSTKWFIFPRKTISWIIEQIRNLNNTIHMALEGHVELGVSFWYWHWEMANTTSKLCISEQSLFPMYIFLILKFGVKEWFKWNICNRMN